MLHHSTEYSTDNGVSWHPGISDEVAGSGKTLTITGLSAGSYQVKLRITPLTGGGPAITSDACTLVVSGAAAFAGAIYGQASATSGLTTAIRMLASVQSASTVSAALTTDTAQSISAAVAGASSVSAAMSTSIWLAAAVSGSSATVSSITTQIQMASAATGSASTSTAITTAIRLASAVAGAATTSADLHTTSAGATFAATLSGLASVSGALSTGIRLLSAAAGAASVTGVLTTAIRLAAGVQGAATTSAALTAPGASAPSAPTGLSLATASGSITPTWNAVSNATSYNVYWKAGADPTETAGTPGSGTTKITGATSGTAITGLTDNGTIYHIAVTAVNGGGESAMCTPVDAAAAAVVQIKAYASGVAIQHPAGTTIATLTSGQTFSLAGYSSFTATIRGAGGVSSSEGNGGPGGSGGEIVVTFGTGGYPLVGTYAATIGESIDIGYASAISNDPSEITNGFAGSGGTSSAGAGGGGNSDDDDNGQGVGGGSVYAGMTLAASGGNGHDDGFGGGPGGAGGYKNVTLVSAVDGANGDSTPSGGSPSDTSGSITIVLSP